MSLEEQMNIYEKKIIYKLNIERLNILRIAYNGIKKYVEIFMQFLNEEKAFFTYPSFDKYLFYQCYRKKMIDTWEKGIVYNYNIGAQYPDDLVPKKYHSDYKICLFNTSHKAWARPNETQIELHEANGWAKEMWMSYDSI